MRQLPFVLLFPVLAAVALVLAAPAAGDVPAKETSSVTFGPFVDDETCAFPLTVEVERTRTTLDYANGDIKRHTELIVTTSANGKTLVGRNAFNVFIDADSPTLRVITGVFEKAQLHGRMLRLQSGRLSYDLEADEVTDTHPGPLAEPPEVCALLGPRSPAAAATSGTTISSEAELDPLEAELLASARYSPERKENVMRRLLTVIPLIGALALPATAAAVEPTRQTVTFTTVAPRPCPNDVTLIGIFKVTHEVTTFYDNAGTPVRELTVITFEATTTNPLTGQSLPGRGIAQGRLIEHDGPDSESERQQLCAALGA
jgi:hypothetical protein